jgi:hypothetical protein
MIEFVIRRVSFNIHTSREKNRNLDVVFRGSQGSQSQLGMNFVLKGRF